MDQCWVSNDPKYLNHIYWEQFTLDKQMYRTAPLIKCSPMFVFQGPYHLISSQPGAKYLDNWAKFPDILPSISILYQTLQIIKTVLIYPSRCFGILFSLCRTVLCFWICRLPMCLITLYCYLNRSLTFIFTDKVKWFMKKKTNVGLQWGILAQFLCTWTGILFAGKRYGLFRYYKVVNSFYLYHFFLYCQVNQPSTCF